MGRVATEIIEQEVKESLERCLKMDLPRKMKTTVKVDDLDALINGNKLLVNIFQTIIEGILRVIDNEFIILITNKNGIMLDIYKNIPKRKKNRSGLIKKGMSFKEKDIGTNAISLALRLGKAIALVPNDHYCNFLGETYSYALPVFENSNIVACLAIVTIEKSLEKELMVIALLVKEIIQKKLKIRAYQENSKSSDILLSDKQTKLLKLLAEGKTEAAAASEMEISVNTVKYHKKETYKKLGTDNIRSAIFTAVKLELI